MPNTQIPKFNKPKGGHSTETPRSTQNSRNNLQTSHSQYVNKKSNEADLTLSKIWQILGINQTQIDINENSFTPNLVQNSTLLVSGSSSSGVSNNLSQLETDVNLSGNRTLNAINTMINNCTGKAV